MSVVIPEQFSRSPVGSHCKGQSQPLLSFRYRQPPAPSPYPPGPTLPAPSPTPHRTSSKEGWGTPLSCRQSFNAILVTQSFQQGEHHLLCNRNALFLNPTSRCPASTCRAQRFPPRCGGKKEQPAEHWRMLTGSLHRSVVIRSKSQLKSKQIRSKRDSKEGPSD